MNTNDIKMKLNYFQSTQQVLQKEKDLLMEELKSLGINSMEEAQALINQIQDVDLPTLESDILKLETELKVLMG